MFCGKCGAAIADNALFCPHCGNVNAAQEQQWGDRTVNAGTPYAGTGYNYAADSDRFAAGSAAQPQYQPPVQPETVRRKRKKVPAGVIAAIIAAAAVITAAVLYFTGAFARPDEAKADDGTSYSIDDYIVEIMTEEGTYYDLTGNKYSYFYHVPRLTVNSYDSAQINDAISSSVLSSARASMDDMNSGFSLICTGCGYDAFMNGSTLSLLVYEYTDFGTWYYSTYNIDVVTGNQLTNPELIKAAGYTDEEFLSLQREALSNGFIRLYGDEGDSFYDLQYGNTTADSNISINRSIFLADGGELRFIGDIFSLGGADSYSYILSVENTRAIFNPGQYAAANLAEPVSQAPAEQPKAPAADTSCISTVTASGCLEPANGRTYYPSATVDGNADTCWIVNTTEPGAAGAWIKYDFDGTYTVSGIRMINGNVYQDGYYFLNGQIRTFRLDFSDGTSQTFTANQIESRSIYENVFYLSVPVETSFIKLTILSGYEGTKYHTNAAMAELEIF